MTELERLRQELIKVRDQLLNDSVVADNLACGFYKEEDWDNKSFFEGRCDAFEDAAALLTQLIEKD